MTEPEVVSENAEADAEWDAVAKLIHRSEHAGMLIECVLWYTRERMAGKDPRQAAAEALYEWDC